MVFPMFNMPCLHHHHQPPPILHSRDSYDGHISSSEAIGLTIGLTLLVVLIAVLVYFWCWRQNHHHRRSRRRNSESRHRRESQREHADNVAGGTAARTAEMEETPQRQGIDAPNEEEPPLPTIPLTIHHHQHEDKHFHGGQYHNHQHEDNQNSNHDNLDDAQGHRGNVHLDHQTLHHRHRHHRFHHTQHLLFPRDPIVKFEKIVRSPSPGIPVPTRADLEAILNGLDIPLAKEPAQATGRVDTSADEQASARQGEEKRRRKRHHHRHHCHHRHRRVVVH
ncbi:hypothetical protein TARUN_6943 [Trichoderma arundinaceum]|uniref:Uncharacterized protein n=1 Tax=Trichoderma arundinaceum TaxID=490622 RepID=A0A395NGT3_TRIAR|nr:hypothetical protein TARUN_6943 [Trichoderma arundinaceum]